MIRNRPVGSIISILGYTHLKTTVTTRNTRTVMRVTNDSKPPSRDKNIRPVIHANSDTRELRCETTSSCQKHAPYETLEPQNTLAMIRNRPLGKLRFVLRRARKVIHATQITKPPLRVENMRPMIHTDCDSRKLRSETDSSGEPYPFYDTRKLR